MILLVRLLLRLLADVGRFTSLLFKPRQAIAAENLILRREITLFEERGIKPRRIDAATRLSLAIWSRLCEWRCCLTVVRRQTVIRWHRAGWRLFWRLKSRPGRPMIPADLRGLIRRTASQNPTRGQERIANELLLKLGIRISPRTVRKYMPKPVSGQPRGDQRWSTAIEDLVQDQYSRGPTRSITVPDQRRCGAREIDFRVQAVRCAVAGDEVHAPRVDDIQPAGPVERHLEEVPEREVARGRDLDGIHQRVSDRVAESRRSAREDVPSAGGGRRREIADADRLPVVGDAHPTVSDDSGVRWGHVLHRPGLAMVDRVIELQTSGLLVSVVRIGRRHEAGVVPGDRIGPQCVQVAAGGDSKRRPRDVAVR